jgi:hypothetical protein
MTFWRMLILCYGEKGGAQGEHTVAADCSHITWLCQLVLVDRYQSQNLLFLNQEIGWTC